MKRMISGVALVAAVTMTLPAEADAQRGPRGFRGPPDGARGHGVENVMRLRDTLQLDESQIRQLDQIRAEIVQRRSAHQAEMEELRSRVQAGQMEAAELREVAEGRRQAAEEIRKQDQERIDAVLNDGQRERLQSLRDQGRAFMRGRQSAMRRGGRGGHGWRGTGPQAGFGRRGFQPGMRQRWAPGPRGRGFRRGGPGADNDTIPSGS